MSVINVGIVAVILFVQKRVVERKVYTMVQGRAPAAVRVRSWRSATYTAAVGRVVVLSLLPLVVVFVAAFTLTRGPVMWWGQWSLASIERALRFTLSQPVTGAISAGDARLLPMILDAAEHFQPMGEAEQAELLATAGKYEPLFT